MKNNIGTITETRFNYWIKNNFDGLTANELEDKLQSHNIPWAVAHKFIYTVVYAVYVGIASNEEWMRFEQVRQYFA